MNNLSEEYCPHCEGCFEIPDDKLTPCPDCGIDIFPCNACELKVCLCDWDEGFGCYRFPIKAKGVLQDG
jgi:hypothetical protein